MRPSLAICGALIVGSTSFAAGAEGLVAFEIVGTSIPGALTSTSDPERGRAVVIHRQQGNCLACHEIPALADQPFHGDEEIGPDRLGAGVAAPHPTRQAGDQEQA